MAIHHFLANQGSLPSGRSLALLARGEKGFSLCWNRPTSATWPHFCLPHRTTQNNPSPLDLPCVCKHLSIFPCLGQMPGFIVRSLQSRLPTAGLLTPGHPCVLESPPERWVLPITKSPPPHLTRYWHKALSSPHSSLKTSTTRPRTEVAFPANLSHCNLSSSFTSVKLSFFPPSSQSLVSAQAADVWKRGTASLGPNAST